MSELTTNPEDPRLGHGVDDKSVPQQEVYLVLSEEERKKGFVRPYRDRYIHVGEQGPKYRVRDLTEEEMMHWADVGYIKYEEYPKTESESQAVGRYWRREDWDNIGNGCGSETIMGRALSETYAREPHFYGATYCSNCKMHRPVREFIWSVDGEIVGS